jgi:hypothetical protein
MENQEQERAFTPEELEQKRKEMLKFYKDSKPYLTAQFEYEEMLMKIDEVRFKRTSIQMQYAMMMNQMEGTDGEEGNDNEPFPQPEGMPHEEMPVRKLKKQ